MTKEVVYNLIHFLRRKGILENVYSGFSGERVLITDDYAAYKKINVIHQSYWFHLLRFARELSERQEVFS